MAWMFEGSYSLIEAQRMSHRWYDKCAHSRRTLCPFASPRKLDFLLAPPVNDDAAVLVGGRGGSGQDWACSSGQFAFVCSSRKQFRAGGTEPDGRMVTGTGMRWAV